MMVGARFGVWLYNHRACPQFVGAGARVRDGGGPSHSRCLRGVGVQFSCTDNLYAICFPVQCSVLPLWGFMTECPNTGIETQRLGTTLVLKRAEQLATRNDSQATAALEIPQDTSVAKADRKAAKKRSAEGPCENSVPSLKGLIYFPTPHPALTSSLRNSVSSAEADSNFPPCVPSAEALG